MGRIKRMRKKKEEENKLIKLVFKDKLIPKKKQENPFC